MKGRKFLCGALFAALLLAGCSHAGGGGVSQLPGIPSQAAVGSVRSAQSVTTSGSTSTVTGTIAGGNSSEFNMNAGSGCGYVNVLTNSSTQWTYNGLTISAGTPVTVTATGSCATSFTASAVTLGSSSSGSGDPNVSGTIYAVSGNTINVSTTSCGYLNVTYTSSTTINYNGYSLSKGTPISAWGTGSCSTSIAATTITLGPTGSGSGSTPNLSGTIYGVSGNTINVSSSSCGYINVTYTSSTTINYNGYTLANGVAISVWGSGSCSTSYAATTITLGAGSSSSSGGSSSMKHVLTGDYFAFTGAPSVSYSSAGTVLSWAETSPYYGSAISAAGIKTMEYIAPFEQASTDPLYSSDNSTFAHDCSGNKIPVPYQSGAYVMNPGSSDLETDMNNWQNKEEGIGHIDAFLYDNFDDTYGLTNLGCNVSASTWYSENASFLSSSAHSVVYNGYGISVAAENLITNSKAAGAMLEECYSYVSGNGPTPPYQTGSDWTANENLEIAATNANKLFFCYNTPTSDASQSIQLRNFIYASFLIGFGPTSSVLWEYFSTPSTVHVFPETQLVPTNPLISSASSVTSYAKGSLYVREYSTCYLNGSSIGHCAAVVNPSSSSSYSIPALSQSYSHAMTISGYGTLDGGSVSASGSRPSSLAPESGVVLVQ